MGYWKRTTLVKKKYETVVGHDSWINLRNYTDNVAWEDERVLLNWNNFNVGGSVGIDTINYYGLAMAVANPVGNNVYNTQIGVVKVNNNNSSYGLVHSSGMQFNSNSNYTVFSGTYYAFFFMVAFNNKFNGLINNSGFEIYANNNLIARHYVTKDYNFLNNFVVAKYTGGWTGNIEIRPTGNRNFKIGYENGVIHNLFIYTQPVTFYSNTASLIAIEGDM